MFKLSIECTKDIDAINITFSDGKVATANPIQRHDPVISATPAKAVMDTGPVEIPEVPDVSQRKVNVADNLQNLDI